MKGGVREAIRKANALSKNYRSIQILIGVMWGVIIITMAFKALIYQRTVDSLISGNVGSIVLILIFVVLILTVAGIILNFLSEYLLEYLKARVRGDLWERLLHRYMIRKENENILSKMLGDVDFVSEISAGFLPSVAIQIIRVVGIFLILLYLNIWLTLLIGVISITHIALFKKLSPKVIELSFEERRAYDDIVEDLREKVEGKYTIWKFSSQSFFHNKFRGTREHWMDRMRRLLYRYKEYSTFAMGIGSISPWLVLFAGVYLVSLNMTTVGTVVAVFYLSPSIYEPLTNLSATFGAISQAVPPINRVWSSLGGTRKEEGVKVERKSVHRIRLKDVTLGYGDVILQVPDLSIERGNRIGIVGPSGSGKSTLVRAIAGIQKPMSGEILINDSERCDYEKFDTILVEENDMLFRGTVLENICLGESCSLDEAKEVAKICCLDDIKLDDPVGLRGENLSLGQRQRICIARALIRNPSVLIIDEALSGVDSEREDRILRRIMERYPDMTLIIVSHRLSTILKMDRTLIVYDGKVEESTPSVFIQSEKYNFIKSQIIKHDTPQTL